MNLASEEINRLATIIWPFSGKQVCGQWDGERWHITDVVTNTIVGGTVTIQ